MSPASISMMLLSIIMGAAYFSTGCREHVLLVAELLCLAIGIVLLVREW